MRSISDTVGEAAQGEPRCDGKLRRHAVRVERARVAAEEREGIGHRRDRHARELAQELIRSGPARQAAEQVYARDVGAARLRRDEKTRALENLKMVP